jgi:DNA-binding LacI/PurR family transcriptional regulator
VDNIDLASYIQPKLTTIAQPMKQAADALSNLMVTGIQSDKTDFKPRRIHLEATFLTRESTAQPLKK